MLHTFISRIGFVLLILFFVSCGGSKHSGKSKNMLPGTWQSQPIVIDGDSKDWPSPYPNYDAKAMIAYASSNDKHNLYITMETGDELIQMKILKQGMAVSVDTTGHKDAQFTINYPLQNDNEDMESMPTYKNMPVHSMEKKLEKNIDKGADEANQFTLEGFKNCSGGYMVTQANACGIKVISRIDEYKEIVWEAVIPFKAIYGKDEITAADANKPISVCFAIKGFKRPDSKNNDASTGTGQNSGMNSAMRGGGGGRGGGKGGGARGSGEDPYERMYESTKTWKHFSIAYQQ